MNARFLALVATASLMGASAHALPRSGESSGKHFLVVAEDLSAWHAGMYGRAQERTVKANGVKTTVDVNRMMVFVGRDLFAWLTVYGTVGVCEAEPARAVDSERSVEYGIGAWLNLLDHDIFDVLMLEQRIRVQGAAQYTTFRDDTFTWGEVAANVTFGVTNEVIGNKRFWPDAISLYAGPCFNFVISDEYDIPSDNAIGVVVGLDVQVSERIGLGVAGEMYADDEAVLGSLSMRF